MGGQFITHTPFATQRQLSQWNLGVLNSKNGTFMNHTDWSLKRADNLGALYSENLVAHLCFAEVDNRSTVERLSLTVSLSGSRAGGGPAVGSSWIQDHSDASQLGKFKYAATLPQQKHGVA